MTIYTVSRKWSTEKAGASTSDFRTFSSRISEDYQVTHSYDTTLFDILNAPGLPVLGALYPGTLAVFCKDVSVSDRGITMSIVSVSYDGQIGPNGQQDPPVSSPPTIEWSSVSSTEPIDVDADGDPLENVNGEPVEGLTKDINDFVLTVTKNYQFISLPQTHQYLDSVNSDTFAGFAPGVAALQSFSAKVVFGDTQSYWSVTARILFRLPYNTTPDKSWYHRFRNEGYLIKDSAGKKVRAVDENKQPRVKPVLLKQDGTIEENPSNAVFLEKKKKTYQLSYSALGLL